MSYVTVAFTKGGVVVADGAVAAANLVAAANSGEAMVAIVKVADNAAPVVEYMKNINDVQQIGVNVASGNLDALVKESFASVLGAIAGLAALAGGPALAVGADMAASEAFKFGYDGVSAWSAQQDWSPLLDLFEGAPPIAVPANAFEPDAFSILSPEEMPTQIRDNFNGALAFTPRRDPLVIDLDLDGLELRAADGQVLFDHNADGIRTGTGWALPDDALLVWDRNGNGLIDSGRELFGVDTLKSNGQLASDGFDALRDLNSNADAVFSAADAQFANLRLWRDLDQDGVADAGELASLAASGIASISLTSTPSGALVNNNRIDSTSVVTRTDGLTTTAGAIDFAENGFAREFTGGTVAGAITITPTAQALPQMRGSGMVRDLREAMSLVDPTTSTLDADSAALLAATQAFAAASTRDAQRSQLDALIQAWGATSDHATSIQTSTLLAPGGAETAVQQWARLNPDAYARIAVLERFNGSNFLERRVVAVSGGYAMQIWGEQLAFLNQAYDALRDSVYGALVTQTRLQPYLDAIELVIDESGIRFDVTAATALVQTKASTDAYNAVADLIDLKKYVDTTLKAVGWEPYETLSSVLQTATITSELQTLLTAESIAWLSTSSTNYAVSGSAGSTVLGNVSNNVLTGSSGGDYLYGLGGNDTLRGGEGTNVLDGGDGDDLIVGEGLFNTTTWRAEYSTNTLLGGA
ncbi:MAG: hypothetical protein Q8L49_01850, partial [Burkholderiaceae bacterium]|nr:hypothetical protein [Burkholderiaceae bacterium]